MTPEQHSAPAGDLAAVSQPTEHQPAEANPRESPLERQLLAAIVDSSDAAILSKTLDGIITSWNRAAENMYGYTAAEAIGKPVSMLAPPEKRAELDDIMQRIARGERVARRETTRVTKDGRRIEISLTVSPIHDSNGKVIGASGIARDITQDKRIQQQAIEWKNRYEATIQATGNVLFDWDSQNDRIVWGGPFAQTFGYQPEECADLDAWINRIHPDDRSAFQKTIEHVLNDRSATASVQFRLQHKDGHYIWLQGDGKFMEDVSGRPVRMVGFVTDVTARKRVKQALQESEQRFRVMTESSPAIMWKTSPQGEALYLSPRWEEVTGVPVADALGQGWHAVIHPEDQARCADSVQRAHTRGEPYQVEVRYRCRSGEYRWHLVRAVPLVSPHGQVTEWLGTSFDIHDRKLAEQELLESQRRFSSVLEIAEDAIISVDEAQHIALFNRGAEKIFGYAREELVGKPLDVLIPDRFVNIHRTHVSNYGASAEGTRRMAPFREIYGKRKDGTEFPAEASISRLVLGDRRVFTVMLRDITERKAAEEALRESEQRLQLASQAAGIGMFDWDMQTNRIIWSDQQLALLGLTREQVRGTYDEWRRLVHPEDLPRIERDSSEAIAQRREGENEFRIIRPDGAVRWLTVRGRIFYDHNGCPVRMLGVNEDVTERKQAEQALQTAHRQLHDAHEELRVAHERVRLINEQLEMRVRERTAELARSEERYRELFENANDAIFTTDLDGRITSVNRAAQRITGYAREEFLRLTVDQLIVPEDQPRIAEKRDEKLRRGGGSTQYQVNVIGKDGRHIPAEVSTRLIMENGRPVGIQGIARDITERKQTEEVLRQVSARLMELRDEERRRFARELHDSTGQNLAALMMNLSMLASNNGNLEPEVQRSIKESLALADACAREIRTISYLLHPPLLDEMGLESALNWLADGFAERSGIKVNLKVSAGRERMPREVELAVFRVIQESLTNIHRHSASRTAEIRVNRGDTFVEFSVADQGSGIPGWRNGEPDWSRTGVGIAGMRERVALLGGKLEIESSAGGTTIHARLPLAKTATAATS